MTRVVVTGMGALSGAGVGVARLWQALRQGQSALRVLPALVAAGVSLGPIAAVPAAALGEDEAQPGALILSDRPRATRYALLAAEEALLQAGLRAGAIPSERLGVVLGTTMGSKELWLAALRAGYRAGAPEQTPSPMEPWGNDAPARALAGRVGAGVLRVVSTACASGNAALGAALDLLREGACDVVLAGGVDAVQGYVIAGFGALRAHAREACRPFDRRRNGLNLGEGAAVLVLETAAHARARGATPLAALTGYGLACDATHMTGPDREGLGAARGMNAALRDAGLPADAIDFVSLHGTATVFNDRMEARALTAVLGARASQVPVNSIKGVLGHTLGASGAFEAVMAVEALRAQLIPPTCGFEEPDPDIDLQVVAGAALARPLRRILSTSSGFGGINAALVLEGLPGLPGLEDQP